MVSRRLSKIPKTDPGLTRPELHQRTLIFILGLTICLNLSVISGLIASNIEENYRLVSTLPILLLVTELDFAHALFIMTIKARSTEETVEANMKILAPRAFMATLLGLACMTFVIFRNSTFSNGQLDAGFRFAIKLSIVAIVFKFILFLSCIGGYPTIIILSTSKTTLGTCQRS